MMNKRFVSLVAGLALVSCGGGGQSGVQPPIGGADALPHVTAPDARPAAGGVPKFFKWPALPKATAGTSLAATTVKLAVEDSTKKTISGTYSTPVTVTDSDTSASLTQGSSLSVNGGAPSRSVKLTKSSDVLKIKYGGLAIAAVTLKAAATGATSASASFAPTLKPVAYSGPTGQSGNEIDLYNPTSGQTGNSGTATFTQPGWAGGGFTNNVTYALSGTNNNCTSYTIPASGSAAAYAVTANANAVTGTCTMTVTGGAGQTSVVLLTYTVSNVGINGRYHR